MIALPNLCVQKQGMNVQQASAQFIPVQFAHPCLKMWALVLPVVQLSGLDPDPPWAEPAMLVESP